MEKNIITDDKYLVILFNAFSQKEIGLFFNDFYFRGEDLERLIKLSSYKSKYDEKILKYFDIKGSKYLIENKKHDKSFYRFAKILKTTDIEIPKNFDINYIEILSDFDSSFNMEKRINGYKVNNYNPRVIELMNEFITTKNYGMFNNYFHYGILNLKNVRNFNERVLSVIVLNNKKEELDIWYEKIFNKKYFEIIDILINKLNYEIPKIEYNGLYYKIGIKQIMPFSFVKNCEDKKFFECFKFDFPVENLFCFACEENFLHAAINIKEKFNVKPDCEGWKAFVDACYKNHLEIVKWLYSFGCFRIEEKDYMLFLNCCNLGSIDVVLWMMKTVNIPKEVIKIEIEKLEKEGRLGNHFKIINILEDALSK